RTGSVTQKSTVQAIEKAIAKAMIERRTVLSELEDVERAARPHRHHELEVEADAPVLIGDARRRIGEGLRFAEGFDGDVIEEVDAAGLLHAHVGELAFLVELHAEQR